MLWVKRHIQPHSGTLFAEAPVYEVRPDKSKTKGKEQCSKSRASECGSRQCYLLKEKGKGPR